MKRIMSLVLALLMVLGIGGTALAELPATWTPFEGDAPTITIGFTAQPDYDEDKETWPTDLFNYVKEYMNCDLKFVNLGEGDELAVRLAGGDLPDIIEIQNVYVSQMLDAGMIVPMDDYLESMPNFMTLSPLQHAINREYFSNGDGKLYWYRPQVGFEGPGTYLWNGYTVRWDWYKELGAPEIKNEDDYIAYLKAAVEAHPTNENGDKVYGYATYNDLWGWWVPGSFYGFHNITDGYHLRSKDSALVNAFYDVTGPIWEQIEFCFKLNQEGLFDPDSFTMTSDDLNAKVANGQYAAIICQWYDKLYDVERQKDPDTLAGYCTLPMEGQGNWSGSNYDGGWSFFYGVTSDCENVEAAMRVIDFLCSEEAARIILTGEPGRIWDYDESGAAVILEEAVANKDSMSRDEWTVWGASLWDGLSGIGSDIVLADGYKANLWKERQIMLQNMRPLDKDFAAHYGVELPYEAAYKLIEEGKAWDKSETLSDIGNMMGTAPTEIARIDNNCREIIIRNLPDLVLAENREAYDALQQSVMAELEDAGIQESMDWWNAEYQRCYDFIMANK